MAYLNCPECFYRVRSKMARGLDDEAGCPRCARRGRAVAMYATSVSLRAERDAPIRDAPGLRDAGAGLTASP